MQGSVVEEVKSRLDIVDVVSTYIKLEKSGSQLKASCPFHNEKSPSFYVSPHKGFFHCFGCGVHGDIFTFITKIENLEFKDALKLLAERAGVELKSFKREEESKSFDILESATRFFQNNLSNSLSAQEYLYNRGLTKATIENFRVGFAQDDWRTLYNFLKKSGFEDKEIEQSGLCIKHEKGFYDRFRSRIMFPINNSTGKVVAFTGRIIGPESKKEGVAKYVNSPETTVYHKSSILFAYDKAKKTIADSKEVILVEGQMDAVMSHQSGVENTVAISGTALTEEHIKILSRFADTVILSLDKDNAGYVAMLRSASVAYFADMFVKVIDFGDAKDPADIVANSPEDWRKAVSETIPFFKFMAESIANSDASEIEKMKKLRKEVLPILQIVKSNLLKESYAAQVGEVLNISKVSILKDIENLEPLQVSNEKKPSKQKNDKSLQDFSYDVLACLEVLQVHRLSEQNKYIENTSKVKALLSKTGQNLDIDSNIMEVKYIQFEKELNGNIAQLSDQSLKEKVLTEWLSVFYNRLLNSALKSTDDIEIVNELIKLRI
jgi:DNA primase